jgi:Uma2 family endonuclease
LRTSFEGPDREYLDGEIVERSLGENQHSEVQARLIEIFYELRKAKPLFSRPELRLKVGPGRFRIPDVAVFASEKPREAVPSSPPLVTIEIVSPDDRLTETVRKLEEFHNWGVLHVWLVDPFARKLFVFSDGGLIQILAFQLPEYGVEIPAAEIFGEAG